MATDVLSAVTCDEEGSPRRCGGQGDLLAGTLGTFVGWSTQFSKREGYDNSADIPNCLGKN